MKTILILLLAFGWPAFFCAQSSSTSEAAQWLDNAQQLLEQGPAADSAALKLAQDALRRIRPNSDYILEGRAYLIAGRAQYNLGYPEDAVPLLQTALNLFQKAKSDSLTLGTLIMLSSAMGNREVPEIDSSLFYVSAARALALKRQDTLRLARIYIIIANIWDEQTQYDSALVYNYLCEDLLKGKSHQLERGQNFYNTGNTLLNRYIAKGEDKDLQDAQYYLQQAIEIFQNIGNQQLEVEARNAAGVAALYSHNFPEAKKELKQSLDIYEQLQDSSGLLNAYYNLATLAETEGKNKEAVLALKNLVDLLKKVGDSSDYQFVRKQFSDSQGKLSITLIENKINNLLERVRNERNEQFMLVSFSIFSTLIIGGFFYYRQKMSAQRALATEKEKLYQEQLDNLLKEQEIEFVRAKLEGEELGRQKVARKIHDGVGGFLVTAKWNLESALEELPQNEKKVAARLNENIKMQDESYRELRRVVYELEYERIPWWQDLQKFCERLTGARKTQIRFYTFNLEEGISTSLGEEARLITQELITNALKHAEASEINVQLSRIDHILSIVVEDNGKGFDPNLTADGVGLKSIQERTGKLSGSISFETGKNAGTSIFVDIPLKPVSILEDNPLLHAAN